jgi:hypothetical protein
MSNESCDAFKIRRAPCGKFYVRGDDEAICLPNGSLRYFETEHDAWAFLTDCDRARSARSLHSGVSRNVADTARWRQVGVPDDRPRL